MSDVSAGSEPVGGAQESAPASDSGSIVEAGAQTDAVAGSGDATIIEAAEGTPQPPAVEDEGGDPASTTEGAAAETTGSPSATDEKPIGQEEVAAQPQPGPATYEDFKMPEGFSVTPEQLSPFTTLLGEHRVPQEAAQALIDMHAAYLKEAIDAVTQHQQDYFHRTQREWIGRFEREAGNQKDTIANDSKAFIARMLPRQEDQDEMWDILKITGYGNHPLAVKMFARAEKKFRERAAPPKEVPGDPKSRMPAYERRYAGKS